MLARGDARERRRAVPVPDDEITLRMPAEMRARLERCCAELDQTLGSFAREAIEERLVRFRHGRGSVGKRRASADERLLAGLRPLVAKAIAASRTWSELQTALRAEGLGYAPRGGGLALVSEPDGGVLCKASEVGPGYAALIRRFRAPFPGHGHAWLARRVLDDPGEERLVET